MAGSLLRHLRQTVTAAGTGNGTPVTDTTQATCHFSTGEGCTPGFWKNHTELWGPTGFSPSTIVSVLFNVPSQCGSLGNATLLQALKFKGGNSLCGAMQILLRAAVARFLNAAHPAIDYAFTISELQAAVNDALATLNRTLILIAAGIIDNANNQFCAAAALQ